MKKSKKYLRISIIAFCFSLVSLVGVSAANYEFNNFKISAYQNWKELGLFRTSTSTNHGTVKLTYMNLDAATFRARSMDTNQNYGSFGPSKVVDQVGSENKIEYNQSYGSGTYIQVQVRNHNWTTATRLISGNFYVDGK